MNFIKSDPTLKVGDLVFSSYHKGEYLFKVINLTRRFLDERDLKYNVYKDAKVGDEYSPLAEIQAVANLSIVNSDKKFIKISKTLDASYLIKVSDNTIINHIHKLEKIILDFFNA